MSKRRNTPEPAAGLLERPLTPRSIVASLLLGSHPPRLAAAHLVRWCGAFGIAEGTTRVALSRMVAAGELRAEGGTYELAGGLRRRQRTQDWALTPEPQPWDGTWRLGLVTAARRHAADRSALRAAAAAARLAELREGVWGRPDNLPREATASDVHEVLDHQIDWWSGRPDGDTSVIVRNGFGVDALAERGQMLLARLVEVTTAVEAGALDRLPEAFVTGAAALQHVRRDPLLPATLTPDGWPGDQLRAAYRRYQPVLTAGARTWLRDQPRPADPA